MPRNTPQKPENQDPVLNAFEETKGEQLNLLDDFEEVNTPKVSVPKDQEQEAAPEPEATQESQEENQEAAPEEPVNWFTGYNGDQYTEAEWNAPVMRGGPTRREVEGWKERYDGLVYFTPFENDVFVWRTLARPEYREVIRDQSLTALDREEYFTEKCVLYPYSFSIEKIKKSRAGIASLLSEMIMDKSGFVAQSAPIKL